MEPSAYRKGKHKWDQPNFDFRSGKSLVSFINRIPNLQIVKFKLSDEQQEVVSQNNNLIVIGRSGTGKTTCALMRMFAIEILFKNLSAKAIFQAEGHQGRYYCKSEYLEYTTGLKTIFLTASPHLITQIKLKYQQLKQHVKRELQKKQRTIRMESEGEQKIQIGKCKIDMRNDLKIIEERQKQINARKLRFTSFTILEDADYPGFFSINQFLMMLDGSMMNSFYARNEDRSRVQENDHGRTRKNDLFKNYKVRLNGKQLFARQCDWQIFNEYFWPTISWKQMLKRKRYHHQKYKEITAIATWTEIISTIKGSCESHTYEGMYLPLQQYLKQSKNKHYGNIEKQTMHEIFLHYNHWKIKSKIIYFDLLDISNHLLFQFKKMKDEQYSEKIMNEIYGKLGELPDFNYLFLDEVQDLPPAIIYLISLVFNNGVYYSGDTAQAIRKGVAFKFSDINDMFRRNSAIEPLAFKTPLKYSLTVNFRSHNQILQIANNIVRILELIFPDAIDSMKKESAQHQGPKPILTYGDSKAVLNLLLKQNQTTFDPQQAIIVRNEQSKQQLPKALLDTKGLILTVEECKGLEYNDVVVFNFFNPALKGKWKILKYLPELYPKKGRRTFHLNEIDDLSQFDQIIVELKMLYTVFTRARCTLVINDQNIPEEFHHIWTSNGLVESRLGPQTQDRIKKQIQSFKESHLSSTQQSWQSKGMNFFENKQYDLAISCYQRVGKEDVCIRIRAAQKQEEVEKKMNFLELKYDIEGYYYQMEDQELEQIPQWKNFKNQCAIQVYPQYDYVGTLYEQIKLYENAADCYFSAENYEKALETYRKCDVLKTLQAGICCQKIAQKIKNKKVSKGQQKEKDKIVSELVFEAATNYQKSEAYTRMMLCLQRHNHYQHCIDKLNQCKQFDLREYFFRKYSIIIINKYYRCNIDKQPPQDTKRFKMLLQMSEQQSTNSEEKIVNLATCQTLLTQTKNMINVFKKVEADKFKDFQIEKEMLNQVNECFTGIRSTKQKLDIIQRHKNQAQIALKIISFKITDLENVDQQVRKEKDQLYLLEDIQQELMLQQRKTQALSLKLNCLQQKQNELIRYLWYYENGTVNDNLRKKMNQLMELMEKVSNLRLFDSSNLIFFFTTLYYKPQDKQLLSGSIKQTTQITEQMTKKMKVLKQQIKSYLEAPVLHFMKLKSKKKKYSNYSYLNQISKNNEDVLIQKRFLPPVPFITQFMEIIEQYEDILKSFCLHAFEKRQKQIKNHHLFQIYSQNSDIDKSLKPYKTFDETANQEQQAIRYIEREYLAKNIATTQYYAYDIMKLENRLQQELNDSMSHVHLTRCLIEKNIEENIIDKIEALNLEKMALISPRSYLYIANSLGLRQCVVQAVIWLFSYKSSIYVNKSYQGSAIKIETTKDKDFVFNMLNPDYFNFQLSRTKYKKGLASDQLIEGALLLGFCEEIANKLSSEEKEMLKLTYLKQNDSLEQYLKQRKIIIDQMQKRKKEQQAKRIQLQNQKKTREEQEKGQFETNSEIEKSEQQQADDLVQEQQAKEKEEQKYEQKNKPLSKNQKKKLHKKKIQQNKRNRKTKADKRQQNKQEQAQIMQDKIQNQQVEENELATEKEQTPEEEQVITKTEEKEKLIHITDQLVKIQEEKELQKIEEKKTQIIEERQAQKIEESQQIQSSRIDDIEQKDENMLKDQIQRQVLEQSENKPICEQSVGQKQELSELEVIQKHLLSKMSKKIKQEIQQIHQINQFIQMDQHHEQSIFEKIQYINYQLDAQEIKELSKIAKQNIGSLQKQIQHLNGAEQKKIEYKVMQFMKIYEPLKYKLIEDEQKVKLYDIPLRSLQPIEMFQKQTLKKMQLKQGTEFILEHIKSIVSITKRTIYQKQLDHRENIYRENMKNFDKKIGKIIPYKDYPNIQEDIEKLFNPFKIKQKQVRYELEEIVYYLWDKFFIKKEKKRQQFLNLVEEIIKSKKQFDKADKKAREIDQSMKIAEEDISQFEQCKYKLETIIKNINRIDKELQQKEKDKIYFQTTFEKEQGEKNKKLKKKRLYLQRRSQVQNKWSPQNRITSPLLRAIFFYQNIEEVVTLFLKNIDLRTKLSHQQRIQIIMLFFAFQNYKSFKEQIKQELSPSDYSNFTQLMNNLNSMLQNSLLNQHNLQFMTAIFQLCKLRLITRQPNMNIYHHFVLVNIKTEKSPLLRYIKGIQKPFSFYVDQKREIILMRVTDILPIIQDKLKINLTSASADSFLYSQIMLFKNEKRLFDKNKILDTRDKIVQSIQAKRCQLFAFLGNNAFIAHQSSVFIYHQLKCYCDLLAFAGSDKFDIALIKTIQKDLDELKAEFDQWKPYADKFELPFRRGQ